MMPETWYGKAALAVGWGFAASCGFMVGVWMWLVFVLSGS